jgi:hypothetical protein
VAASCLLLAALLWDLWRVVWLQNTLIGIAGGPLLNVTGPGATGSGWFSWIGMPVLLGLPVVTLTALSTRTAVARAAPVLLAIAAIGWALWTVLALGLGLGLWADATWHGSWLFLSYPHPSPWVAWGRWVFDGVALVVLAVLLGFGPRSPAARRAVFVGMVAWIADQAWRIAVTVLSGAVPLLFGGLGPLDAVQSLVWILLGAMGVAFVAITGQLPDAIGPSRRGLLYGFAALGMLYGLEASILYGLGLLHLLGIETTVDLAMPFHPGLLALYRVGWGLAALFAVGMGSWREPDTHTTADIG